MSRWIPYVVRQGDHLSKLANRYGFDAASVWQDDRNASLRKARSNPHVLRSGDLIYMPEPPRAWLPIKVGNANRLVATVPTVKISLMLQQNGKAIASAVCVVHGLAKPNEFTTGGDGSLEFDAPVTLELVTLEFPALSLVRRLRIGHLDPIDEPSGVTQRLRNMGHVSAALEALNPGAARAHALKSFQTDQGLPVTGALDDETRKRLQDEHGC